MYARRFSLPVVCSALMLAVSGAGRAQSTPPFPVPPQQNGMVVGPSYKLAGITVANDLVKLLGSWWGLAYEKFPPAAGMNYGDYSEGDNPDPTDPTSKVVLPTRTFSAHSWTPTVLAPLAFKFETNKGLVEVSGFLPHAPKDTTRTSPLPPGITEDQAAAVRELANRYGKPTRIIGNPSAPSLGAAYVWEFDRAVVSVSSVSFRIVPASPQE